MNEFEKIVEEIAEPTVLNAYGVKELSNRLRKQLESEERLGITKKEFEEELKHFYHYADEVQYTRGYDKGVSEARKQIVEEIDIDAMVDDYSNHLHEWGSVSVYKQAIEDVIKQIKGE